jgi:DNA-binding NarL/FixJ family response regulator
VTRLARSVLIVDDEFLIVMSFCALVEDMGIAVCGTADSCSEAIALAVRFRPAIVLMDVRLRGSPDGVDAAMAIHADVGSKVIFVTGSREHTTVERINTDHPFATLFKPVPDDLLRGAIAKALEAADQ